MSTALVFVETLDGKIADITYELLDLARRVTGDGGTVTALAVMPAGLTSELGAADRVLWADNPDNRYLPESLGKTLAQAVDQVSPDLVLVGNTAVGMDVATYAASRAGCSTIASVQKVEPAGQGWQVESVILGGKMVATAEVTELTILQVLAGAGDAERGHVQGNPTVETITAAEAAATVYEGLAMPDSTDVDITKQDILVSIGRGIGDKDNIEVVEELAEALGAVVSASRPVIDAGWLPKSRQVGKSGKKVKPKVYLALGISGAPEHLEGMRDADCIIAVNTDPKAPIFDVAHYGIVEDILELVPALTEKVKGA